MYIILGASGQVGSTVVSNLIAQGKPVKAVVHDPSKVAELEKAEAEVAVADAKNLDQLTSVFRGGSTLFVLTPESEKSDDIIGDTKTILHNYRKATEGSGIETIVSLSSMGAQHATGTGNLQMSYLLEHAFAGLAVKQVFIRPAYYFSNWLPNLDSVKNEGVLPTFFPTDMPLPMVAPHDVADLIAKVLIDPGKRGTIYEITGPANYTSIDVAEAFSRALNKPVKAIQTPRDQWADMLKKTGVTDNGIENFIEMTEAVIDGRTTSEVGENHIIIQGDTTLDVFVRNALKQ